MGGWRVYLVVDKGRENSVIGAIQDGFTDYEYVERQINTGDYLICAVPPGGDPQNPTTLCCIERKTLPDFASSIVDGRYENREKMKALRDSTGCQLYWFVEGTPFPKPTTKYKRVPHKSILSAQTKLMIRDGISIVLTQDEEMTATRLHQFVAAYHAQLNDKPGGVYRFPTTNSNNNGASLSAPLGGKGAAAVEGGGGDRSAALVAPQGVTGRIEKRDDQIIVDVWSRLKGISAVLGRIISRQFSVAQVIRKEVGDQIENLKSANGRKANKDAIASLRALQRGDRERCVKVLSGVEGISVAVAEQLIKQAGGLKSLLSRGAVGIAMMQIEQKNGKRRVGDKRAEKIVKFMGYVHVPGAAGAGGASIAEGAASANDAPSAGQRSGAPSANDAASAGQRSGAPSANDAPSAGQRTGAAPRHTSEELEEMFDDLLNGDERSDADENENEVGDDEGAWLGGDDNDNDDGDDNDNDNGGDDDSLNFD